jgi:hypothetical protein
MKSLTGTLRIAALALVVGLLFSGGESQSADFFRTEATASIVKTIPAETNSQKPGAGALVFGAYGFLLILRRRTQR